MHSLREGAFPYHFVHFHGHLLNCHPQKLVGMSQIPLNFFPPINNIRQEIQCAYFCPKCLWEIKSPCVRVCAMLSDGQGAEDWGYARRKVRRIGREIKWFKNSQLEKADQTFCVLTPKLTRVPYAAHCIGNTRELCNTSLIFVTQVSSFSFPDFKYL